MLWSSIPQRDKLLNNLTFKPFSKFILALEEQLGVSRKRLEHLLKKRGRWSFRVTELHMSVSKVEEKHPHVFESLFFDPEKTRQDLESLKIDIDALKKEYAEDKKLKRALDYRFFRRIR